ncbi:MAG TPA: zinc-binding dehydrogenase [Bdellovibrionota bacterium]|nr:zinc-binding dehydrogenase [Bdellovibrionota bacterium]
MKAIQYSRHGGPEVLAYVDLPDPVPGPGQAVVRLKAAGINHIDIHIRRGIPGMKTPLPHIPGCDGSGIVDAVGAGVTNVEAGQRVTINPGTSCGVCEQCGAGEKSLCHRYQILGEHGNGTYAEKIAIPAVNALPIPDSVSFETAAAAPLAYLTAWSMVVSKARVRAGDAVLVMSAGSGVSTAAIQICKMLGAKVFATASTPEKADRAKKDPGADVVIDYTTTPIDKEIRTLTEKRGVDVIIDHVGGEQWLPMLRSLRKGGTLVTCGATAGFEPKEDLRQIFFRQLRILGSTMGNDAELHSVLKLVFEGRLKPIIDKSFPLKQAPEAHRRMEERKSFGKIVLIP